jgi:hypothetical protein
MENAVKKQGMEPILESFSQEKNKEREHLKENKKPFMDNGKMDL